MSLQPEISVEQILNGQFSECEREQFERQLVENPEFAENWARRCELEVMLENHFVDQQAISRITTGLRPVENTFCPPEIPAPDPFSTRRSRRLTVWGSLVLSTSALLIIFCGGYGENSNSAAAHELNRIILAIRNGADRTYQIVVERDEPLRRRVRKPIDTEDRRPPKPPLKNALLYVREGGQFVLIRQTDNGEPFVTGCDGQISWAIRPDGPVRFSHDIKRFNRDVPGHEYDLPLTHLRDGLSTLQAAYAIEQDPSHGGATRRLTASPKSARFKGPNSIEMTYRSDTFEIQELRFVDMPYGQERELTLRLKLMETKPLAPEFFHFRSHCPEDRPVEIEE